MNTYAYIRVSTKEQNIDRQIDALEPYDIPKQNIFCDYQSGKDFERNGYQMLIQKLQPGDLLIVKSIDRLGRNYDEILIQWQYITKELKADIKVLDMEILDTSNKADNLTGVLIADMVLQLLAYVAQTERDLIRQRQAEGIAAAKLKGKQFGRAPVKMPNEFEKVCTLCMNGIFSTREGAKKLKVRHSTFYRRYKEWTKSMGAFSDNDACE